MQIFGDYSGAIVKQRREWRIPNIDKKSADIILLGARVEMELLRIASTREGFYKYFARNPELFRLPDNRDYYIDLKNPLSDYIPDGNLYFWQPFTASRLFNQAVFIMISLYGFIHYGTENIDITATISQLATDLKINKENIWTNRALAPAPGWLEMRCPYSLRADWLSDTYEFFDKDGAFLYFIGEGKYRSSESKLFQLPYSWWLNLQTNSLHMLPIPGRAQLELYNLPKIHSNPRSPVIITEHLSIAKEKFYIGVESGDHVDNDYIWTSWYGYENSIDDVNWEPLRNHKTIEYLVFIAPGYSKTEAINTAHKILRKLKSIGVKEFSIIELDVAGTYKRIGYFELHDYFKSYGFEHSNFLPDLNSKNKTAADAISEKSVPFLIHPVLKRKALTILYAPAGCGKSWLAISMGLAVATGQDVFDKWQVKSKPKQVLYISGEMDNTEIRNRLVYLKKIYPSEDHGKFAYDTMINADLSSEPDQRKLEERLKYWKDYKKAPIQLLILDNLSCLVKNGDYPSGWNNFFNWLNFIRKMGITVLLVHHANKARGQLGTGAIKNKADFMIHADTEDEIQNKIDAIRQKGKEKPSPYMKIARLLEMRFGSKIMLYVSMEKTRSIAKSDALPFWLTLDLRVPEWITRKIDYSMELQSMEDDAEEELDENNKNNSNTYEPSVSLPRLSKKFTKMTTPERIDFIHQCWKIGMSNKTIAAYAKVSPSTISKFRRPKNKGNGTPQRDAPSNLCPSSEVKSPVASDEPPF